VSSLADKLVIINQEQTVIGAMNTVNHCY